MKSEDNNEIKFIKVKRSDGKILINKMNKEFKNKSIINPKFKVLHEKDYIFFPLIENLEEINVFIDTLGEVINFQIVSKNPVLNVKYNYRTLEEVLKNKIRSEDQELIPRSYDIVGNVAIIEFNKFEPEEEEKVQELKGEIAKAIVKVNKKVKTVFEKKSEIKGSYRLRNLALLYGENRSETIYKENNCIFKLDVRKTYFTPRLVYERRRIASNKINVGEIIVDMFAGVGPFSIQIAKNHEIKIHAFDVNPNAYHYLKENININKMKGVIIPHNLDVKHLINPSSQLGRALNNNIDRIIMNLPENSMNYLDVACFLMKKSGGILHYYQFCEKPDPIEKAIENLRSRLNKFNWNLEKIIKAKIVKPFSPKSDMIVVDLVMKSLRS